MKRKSPKKVSKSKPKGNSKGQSFAAANEPISEQQPLLPEDTEVTVFNKITSDRHLDINKLLREKYVP